ncbi:MAG: SagB/ThcOx family dehydrogenase [Candidatus Bathyarchaeia archaeon]
MFGNKILKLKFENTKDEGLDSSLIEKYMLPLPKFTSNVFIEEALAWRRSIRIYKDEPITMEHLSMLLWAAQGVTELKYRFKTAPSAGATYPLELYIIVGDKRVIVNNEFYLPSGSYKYDYKIHAIKLVKEGDLRESLAEASLNQEWIKKASINIVICALYERTTRIYGERGYRYVYMECGHVGQNVHLMATALNLGAVVIGAFYDEQVKNVINAEAKEHPLYIIPIGVPKEPYRITEKEISEYYEKVRKI